jgi:hypothetical protein
LARQTPTIVGYFERRGMTHHIAIKLSQNTHHEGTKHTKKSKKEGFSNCLDMPLLREKVVALRRGEACRSP